MIYRLRELAFWPPLGTGASSRNLGQTLLIISLHIKRTVLLQTASVNKPGAMMSLAARMPHLYTRDVNPATGNMVRKIDNSTGNYNTTFLIS